MINKIKLKIKAHFIKNGTIPDITESLKRLKKLGYIPDKIFDVGAYEGGFTQLVAQVWPETKIFCFEALPEKVNKLKNLETTKNQITVIEGIVGNEDKSEVNFHVAETASSVLEEWVDKTFPLIKTKMHKLDTLIDNNIIPLPSLLKIDTQGFEYQVLKGIERNIKKIDVILAELNFLDIHKDVVLISEIIHYLRNFDFVPYDITEIHRRPLDKAINQVDLIFVKRDSFLRENKKWKN